MATMIRCCQPGCGWRSWGNTKQASVDKFTAHWKTAHAGLPAPALMCDKTSQSTLVHAPVTPLAEAPASGRAAGKAPEVLSSKARYWAAMTTEQRSAEMRRRVQVMLKNRMSRRDANHVPEAEPSVRFCPHCGHNLMIYGTALKVAHKLSNH